MVIHYFLKAFIANEPVGNDIIADCLVSGLSESTKALCAKQPTGKYKMPDLAVLVPNIALYTKMDEKFGLFNDYSYDEHFFGSFNLYVLNRTDIYQRLTKDVIASGSKIDFPNEENTEMTLQSDFKIGHKEDNLKIFASIEDFKISTLSKRATGSKETPFGYSPLFRVHADTLFKLEHFSINPFVGIHSRSGYELSNGAYLGARAGANFWEDSLNFQLRGMFDKQYFTLSPKIQLWIIQIEYMLKTPTVQYVDNIKISKIESINIRLFF